MPVFSEVPELPEDSWLYRAYDYARQRSQLPDSTVFWTLMSYCGAALQDSMMVDWTVKPIFANLPLLIVAPSGRGKTGAINVIEPLFDRFLPTRLAEDSTAEAMTKDLALSNKTPYGNTAGLWVVPELADVFGNKDYQQGSIARLTRLFDAPKDRRVSRAGQQMKLEIGGHCVLTWVAGTTVEWLEKHVDDAVSAGGFLPRLIVHYSDEGAKFVPDPQRDERLILELNSELNRIIPNRYIGQQRIKLADWGWNEVYRRIYDERKEVEGTFEESFVARRAENLLRIWLILSTFARSASFSTDFALAEVAAKSLERQAIRLTTRLNSAGFAQHAEKVLAYVRAHGGITYARLCQNLHCTSRDLKFALLDLRERGDLEWNGSTGLTGLIKLPGAN